MNRMKGVGTGTNAVTGMRQSALEENLDDLARSVIGAAIEVHRALGAGYPEACYEEALTYELELRGLSCVRQAPVRVVYKGRTVGEGRVDILVENALVIELKAVDAFSPMHAAQLLSYLRATGKSVGLLFNFNVLRLKEGGIKRYIYEPQLP